jgi:chitinase
MRGAVLFRSALLYLSVAAICLLSKTAAVAQPGGQSPSGAGEVGHRLLVGYFPQWGLYDDKPYTVKTLVDSGGASMLDQLNYAQGFVTGGQCSVADPNADLNYTFAAGGSVDGIADLPAAPVRGNFHQLMELKRKYPRLKILISLEGRAADFSADAQPEQRTAFVASCVNLFLKGNLSSGGSIAGLFDGIDLDWEYPRGVDAANYLPLLKEFRRQMDAYRPGLVLSVALGPSPHMSGDADLAAVGRVVDQAGLMTYDFNGPWSSTTGLIAPLSTASADDGSVERSVDAWKAAGVPARKLLMGLPFYGYGWRRVADEDHGFGQDGNPIRGDHPYRFIQTLLTPRGSEVVATGGSQGLVPQATTPVLYRDPVSHAPWLFDGDSFWTYEDPVSIRSKAVYAADQKLAGFMVWELSDDTADATLLKAAYHALSAPAGETAPEDQSSDVPAVSP